MTAASGDDDGQHAIEGKVLPLHRATASYEVTLDSSDDEDEQRPVRVDAGDGTMLPAVRKRKPIVPVHLDTPAKIRIYAAGRVDDLRYHAAFQGLRIPVYTADTLRWASVGTWRFVDGQRRWWWQDDQALILAQAVIDRNGAEYRRHHNHVREVRARRGGFLVAEAFAIAVAGDLWWAYCPAWAQAVTGTAAVLALARLGRPRGRALFTSAMVTPRVRRINSDTVVRAYKVAGLCNPEKPGMELTFPGVMSRDEHNMGSRVPVSLPYGVTFDDARRALPAIASGLDVKLSQVYLQEDDDSDRSHVLYVADRDPLRIPAGRTPLLDLKPRNIWHDAPFGLDQFGRQVEFCLMWISILIGAQPRKGKTFSARLLVLFAALDPYVRLVIIDGKSSPDWTPFKIVAHRFIQGSKPTRHDDPVERVISALDEIIAHIDEVNDFLGTLSTTECPHGKITEELSRKYPQCAVWVLMMEEFQVYLELDDQPTNKLIAGKLSDIKARGPSAGVTVLSATQKPSQIGSGDVQRLATRYRDNHDARFALRCGSRDVSNAVLGNEAYGEGYDASKLPLGKRYRGVGILYGLVDEAPTVRTYLADGQDAEAICEAARAHRERAGTVTGDAAGDEYAVTRRDVLADALAVFEGDERLQWGELAERLAGQFPDRWAAVTADAISAQVRDLGVPTAQAKRGGVNRQGCKRSDVAAARMRVSA